MSRIQKIGDWVQDSQGLTLTFDMANGEKEAHGIEGALRVAGYTWGPKAVVEELDKKIKAYPGPLPERRGCALLPPMYRR